MKFTADNFQSEVLESKIPVMIDFYADWCGPCRMVAPIVKELAEEYEGQIKIGKLNIDEHPDIPTKYGIMAIPTILFFKDGEVVKSIQGAVPKTKIDDIIQSILKQKVLK